MTAERILLVGMMGAGKTTVGTALSRRTGWPYLDNDELLRRSVGKDTRRLLDEDGEPALRRAESQSLTIALTDPPPLVAGIAGGVVEDPANRERLRSADAFVVWLRARIDTLAARVGSGTGRPWLQPDPRTALARLYDGRAPLYAEVASYVVDVDDLPVDDVADAILAALRG